MKIVDCIEAHNVLSGLKVSKLTLDEKITVVNLIIALRKVGEKFRELQEELNKVMGPEELVAAMNAEAAKEADTVISPISVSTRDKLVESNPDMTAGELAILFSLS